MVEFDAILQILNGLIYIFSCEIGKSSVAIEYGVLRMHENAVVEKRQTDWKVALVVHLSRFVEEKYW